MTARHYARRLAWPAILLFLSFGLVLFRADLADLSGQGELVSLAGRTLIYFAIAWFVSRVLAMTLDRAAARRRPYPRLLKDLVTALLFTVAFAATVALFLGQGAVGALAGSGLILAMLGFAIRNVVADTLSGIALGIEGPFRIGDWVEIDGVARGRVIEIGWRTTRILTRGAAYMILPNSQIARQRITNYSAPRPQYRAQISITLDHDLSIESARVILLDAVRQATLIQQDPAPDVRVLAYEEGGITYAVRYWLSRFERDIDCRDEVYGIIDERLRNAGIHAPHRRIRLVPPVDGPMSHTCDRAPVEIRTISPL
ncbi:mechanosensitive ion channel family protein [Oceanibacterium hippocampi]|uniref:Small-conductance mechanosensitive channel n=1 Tax=Oceanibacterium hippocampi TaxID=745714 RepID=A0A1Y5TK64_9PROT|nr:mechanosensitive ion channel family protein [Oceanibacterium hippocampi]SLN65998.1 Miniconductance mechanosensitive channel MscM precursor [Oceanibacterium hippocampi]